VRQAERFDDAQEIFEATGSSKISSTRAQSLD
jgi:hypothetical protein